MHVRRRMPGKLMGDGVIIQHACPSVASFSSLTVSLHPLSEESNPKIQPSAYSRSLTLILSVKNFAK